MDRRRRQISVNDEWTMESTLNIGKLLGVFVGEEARQPRPQPQNRLDFSRPDFLAGVQSSGGAMPLAPNAEKDGELLFASCFPTSRDDVPLTSFPQSRLGPVFRSGNQNPKLAKAPEQHPTGEHRPHALHWGLLEIPKRKEICCLTLCANPAPKWTENAYHKIHVPYVGPPRLFSSPR